MSIRLVCPSPPLTAARHRAAALIASDISPSLLALHRDAPRAPCILTPRLAAEPAHPYRVSAISGAAAQAPYLCVARPVARRASQHHDAVEIRCKSYGG